MSARRYSEDSTVEQPAIALLDELGWKTVNAYHEQLGVDGTLGRDNQGEVVLQPRLRAALERLNPELPIDAIDQAIEQLTADRSAVDVTHANREIHQLMRDGVPVRVRDNDGVETPEVVKVVDWADSKANDFLLVSQLWITGDMYRRRADLVGFVNGLPLLFVELKGSHRRLEKAYNDNLTDYRDAIGRIFWYNAAIVLSNGSESRIGTITSRWEHFATWKKLSDEREKGVISLETMLRGTCEPSRLLDLTENFTAFLDKKGGLVKLLAKNHQYLGVNNAIARLTDQQSDQNGKLGVFWHTQGSGKTMSMLFFSQKVLRKQPGNWTFVIVTDRTDLDDQVYKEFTDAGVLGEGHVQATSGAHLRQLLGEDHRYVFTLIQKFRTDRGELYPKLTDRSDVIVITDEAHRSQYDTLALNMRMALPKARFMGFTGTPLIAGEEHTKRVFGDYVSVYNFAESVRDGATVPLYYENRIPELQLANENFSEELEQILEDAELDEAQEARLARHFGREYHLITRDERLNRIAEDLINHFLGRGFLGKAMVVSIDKATAVRMYDKVRARWDARLADNLSRLSDDSLTPVRRETLELENELLRTTDMAVVVSQGQNEIADMRKRGLDIQPHRQRMLTEDLESRFKDAGDPLSIVFVCAMWTTGFDVPSCSTIYLDKPMRNHSLMQTIARANRVFPAKTNGMIVDYAGVFARLQQALSIYASDQTDDDRSAPEGNNPVEGKQELIAWLRTTINDVLAFCKSKGAALDELMQSDGFQLIALTDNAVDKLLVDDDTKSHFLSQARLVDRLFRAILPDLSAGQFGEVRAVLNFLIEKIRALTPQPEISHVTDEVSKLLDRSVAANEYVIHAPDDLNAAHHRVDLASLDFEALATRFARTENRRTEVERLRAAILARAARLARLNPTRMDWLERFQAMIDEYNAGSVNIEEFFRRLIDFTRDLDEETRRGFTEGLTEEQLAIYDLLRKPPPELNDAERFEVKMSAAYLLALLKREKLVLDWRKRQQTRAAVRLTVEETLDVQLPQSYTEEQFKSKCDAIYQHVYDSYFDNGRSVYDAA